jgi:hypothetical protein
MLAVQLADMPVPVNVQVVVENVPVPLLLNVTVPVGVVAPVADVSVTVAVHVVGLLTATLAGVHETLTVVACRALTASRNVPLLPEWVVSLGVKVPVING